MIFARTWILHLWPLLLLAISKLAICDADIDSVRIKYDYEDASGKGGDPEEKYWRTFLSRSLLAGIMILTPLQMNQCKWNENQIGMSRNTERPPKAFIHITMAGILSGSPSLQLLEAHKPSDSRTKLFRIMSNDRIYPCLYNPTFILWQILVQKLGLYMEPCSGGGGIKR